MLRALLRLLRRRRWQRRHVDPAWTKQTPVLKFAGHDPSKAAAVFEREQRQAAQRRARAAKAQRVARKTPATIHELPRKQA
jgi:hypothetical protein